MDGVGKQLRLTNISLSKDGGKSAKVTDIAPGHPGSQEEAASRWRCPHERAVQAQASLFTGDQSQAADPPPGQ